MNDFAKSQLMKYGWSEGKGLGKHEGGITEALKPKLKFDSAGIGYKGNDWNNWWENAFNKAASSITINSESHSVSISFPKEETNNPSEGNQNEKLSNYSAAYRRFLKTSTLLNGNLLESDSVTLPKQITEENITHTPLTDDELFKICGGRTAHKGARHGLTLNGKLKRIAEQEQAMLNTNLGESISTKVTSNNTKLNDNKSETIICENTIFPIISPEEVSVLEVTKSTRRRNKRRINDLTHQLDILCNVSDSNEKNVQVITKKQLKDGKKGKHRKKKRRKEKRRLSIPYDIKSFKEDEADDTPNDISLPTFQKVDKDLTEENIGEKLSVHVDKEFIDIPVSVQKKHKKKKKCQDKQYLIATEEWADEGLCGSQPKKRKKSQKRNWNFQLLIDNEDINTSDSQFSAPSCNKVALQSCEVEESSVFVAEPATDGIEAYFKKKADYLNAKITKKKLAKLRIKERIKLATIRNCLETVHLNIPKSVEGKHIQLPQKQ